MQDRLTRGQVAKELTWNLDDIFPTPEAWEAEFKQLERALENVTAYRGRLSEDGQTLLSCLEAQEELAKIMVRVGSYASLKLAGDGTDAENQMNAGRMSDLGSRIQAETAFIKAEILRLDADDLKQFMKDAPGLASFRRLLEQILRQKPYTLSDDTEEALAALGGVLSSPMMIYERSKSSDLAFEPVKDGQSRQRPVSIALYEGKYEGSSDLVLRRNAFWSFTEGLRKFQNTYGATLATEIKKNVVLARLRGFPSAIDAELYRQEVTREVYDHLHDIILKELSPAMRRYARLRKRLLGLDQLYYCDLEAPLDPDFAPETTFKEGSEYLIEGLRVLGDDYANMVKTAVENRWVDLADNVGKATGAFCNPIYDVHPYILMTWTDNMRNVLTLAHELGHAGHGILYQRHHKLTNSRGSMFFTEAPSTINELLVASYILNKTTDQRMRRWVIMQMLMTYHHNYVRHLIEGELQRRIYALAEEGQTITASVLSRVQGEILEEYWGDELVVDEGARLTWMRQVHYYVGLSPYGYSAGLTVGTAVTKAIQEEGQPAVDRWLKVLETGGTKPPLELAKMAGVDMEKPEAIRQAVNYVSALVDELIENF